MPNISTNYQFQPFRKIYFGEGIYIALSSARRTKERNLVKGGALWRSSLVPLLQRVKTVHQTARCVGRAGVLMFIQPRTETVDTIESQ